MSNNNSSETSKHEILTNTTSKYNDILKLMHYKRISMKTIFDSSGEVVNCYNFFYNTN